MLEPDQKNNPLYDPRFEHDSCDIGAELSLKGINS